MCNFLKNRNPFWTFLVARRCRKKEEKISIKRIRQRWAEKKKHLVAREVPCRFSFQHHFLLTFSSCFAFRQTLQRVSSSRLFEAALIWPYSLACSAFRRVFGREFLFFFCKDVMCFWARISVLAATAAVLILLLLCFFGVLSPKKATSVSDNSTRPIRGYLPKT